MESVLIVTDLGAKAFQAAWDRLPDRTEPPTEGPFYPGDMAKVNGEPWVYCRRMIDDSPPGQYQGLREVIGWVRGADVATWRINIEEPQ